MVTLTNVRFGYGKRRLYENLNLNLHAGHLYGLLGQNGAGKSSLLKMMAGLVFPESGQCRVLDQEPRHRQPSLLRQVYFLPEESYVPPGSATRFMQTYAPFYPNFDVKLYQNYLHTFNVEADQAMEKMSQGQRKKALISFALAANTPVLLMDEPTNGLDIPSKRIFRQLVAGALDAQRVVVISTHQVRDLDRLIDYVLVLHDGQIRHAQDFVEANEQLDLELLFDQVVNH